MPFEALMANFVVIYGYNIQKKGIPIDNHQNAQNMSDQQKERAELLFTRLKYTKLFLDSENIKIQQQLKLIDINSAYTILFDKLKTLYSSNILLPVRVKEGIKSVRWATPVQAPPAGGKKKKSIKKTTK